DSVSRMLPWTGTRIVPAGFMGRNWGRRCAPAGRLTGTDSKGTPSSWSVQRARIDRVGGNSYRVIGPPLGRPGRLIAVFSLMSNDPGPFRQGGKPPRWRRAMGRVAAVLP